jgi:hypothetical protein
MSLEEAPRFLAAHQLLLELVTQEAAEKDITGEPTSGPEEITASNAADEVRTAAPHEAEAQ